MEETAAPDRPLDAASAGVFSPRPRRDELERGGAGASHPDKVEANRWGAVLLCLLGALVEGFDLQASGVAASGMARAFALSPAQLGIVFSASTIGLIPGALGGGRLADRVGRKAVLIASILLFGAFTLVTAAAWSYPSLVLARFLTGVGLGSAMPNLIALCSEATARRFRQTAIALMYAGMPLGGAIAAWLALHFGAALTWRTIFLVGGLAPVAVAPMMMLGLHEARSLTAKAAVNTPGETIGRALFAEGRASLSLALWIAYFFTLVVLYLLQNWLPLLVVGRGFSRADAALVQMLFNIGGATGSIVMGRVMDRGWGRCGVALIYAVLLAAMAGLAGVNDLAGLIVCAAFAGLGAIGGQMVLYGLAPLVYDKAIRGTGVGAAVAVGRLGSIAGPVAAGQVLSAGVSASTVLACAAPGVAVAAISALVLIARTRVRA